jgi:hypothetical protein
MQKKTSKDVESQESKFVVVTVAFGHVNEWGSAYVESSRTRNCSYIGRTDQTTRAFVLMKANGEWTPIAKQWLDWKEGEETHLSFYWLTEQKVVVSDKQIKWFFEGQSVCWKDLPHMVNFAGAGAIRMYAPGTPPLATLALRNQQLCRIYRSASMLVNEPLIWIPKIKMQENHCILEILLRHLCAGVGSTKSPIYFQMRKLLESEFGMSPWEMYLAAGCRTEIMCHDVYKKKGVLNKCLRIVDMLIKAPLEMLGISMNVAKKWLKSKDLSKFCNYIPWWFADDESPYQIPNIEDSYVTAKRVESTLTSSRSFIPAREMGYEIGSQSLNRGTEEVQDTIIEIKIAPQLPPPVEQAECELQEQNVQG